MISLVPSPHCVHLQRQSWKPLVICGEVTVIFGLARPMSAPPLDGEAHTTCLPLPEPAHRGLNVHHNLFAPQKYLFHRWDRKSQMKISTQVSSLGKVGRRTADAGQR